jgi:hypothetical protein
LAALAAVPAAMWAADAAGPAQAPCCGVCPHCHCQEQIVYKECITHRCKLVPDNKPIKKTVYEVKEVPYCLPKLPPFCSLFHHKGCCDKCGCVQCDCPRYKKVLIKKEITCGEICGYKCEVEEIVTRVPCRVCTSGCPNCTDPAAVQQAAPPPAPTAPAPMPPSAPAPDSIKPPTPPAPEPYSLGAVAPPPVTVAK